jgi:DNA-binding response OmpR family regulator
MASVLLVDDEPAITESLAYALGRAGFDTSTAGTLSEADARMEDDVHDLVVLDLMLPDGNGLDWLRALRQHSRVPVIILSSHDDAVEHVVALEMGADDYIDKPFSPREVVARVRAVLRRVQPEPQTTADARLRLDADRREAWADGALLNLSRTEFDLLAVFIAAPGRVYPRGMLLTRVWGPDVAVAERTVDVHVKALRRKLPADTIETVRGVGYRLTDR